MFKHIKDNQTLITWISIAILAIISIIIVLTLIFKKKENKDKKTRIKNLSATAIFAGFSIILYLFFKFPLPFLPSFLKLNFSNLPIVIGTFLLGPFEALLIVVVRTIVVLPFTHSFGVGEFADFIISISIVMSGGFIYKNNKTKKGAIISLLVMWITWIVVAIVSNVVILIPAYIALYFGSDVNAFIKMLAVIPNITENNYLIKYILFGALPFNLIISTTVISITFMVYKRLSLLFHRNEVD